VRHRLASFSQESQRYVDLHRGDWQAIIPDAIAAHPQALAELNEFWRIAEEKYAKLRGLGIRKEDARFLLPNAAETRIVATMNFAAWSHFFWLRAVDTAAQWEIRLMGQRALTMLYAIAPTVFQSHWDVYQERFAHA
jgi:thymidylate synthase (FAD)